MSLETPLRVGFDPSLGGTVASRKGSCKSFQLALNTRVSLSYLVTVCLALGGHRLLLCLVPSVPQSKTEVMPLCHTAQWSRTSVTGWGGTLRVASSHQPHTATATQCQQELKQAMSTTTSCCMMPPGPQGPSLCDAVGYQARERGA